MARKEIPTQYKSTKEADPFYVNISREKEKPDPVTGYVVLDVALSKLYQKIKELVGE